jgi:dTDP-4-dehydrorhamnose 3,5-epimerase-like enzyme
MKKENKADKVIDGKNIAQEIEENVKRESSTYRDIMEFLVGDDEKPRAYFFPPVVLHGYKCLKGPMHIIYLTSGVYDLSDEVHIPYDDREIGYDWLAEPPIK